MEKTLTKSFIYLYVFVVTFFYPLIYIVWGRRTDELVDGPNASNTTTADLDRWEERLENVFMGRPLDMFDAALSDTVAKFPLDIQVWTSQIS